MSNSACLRCFRAICICICVTAFKKNDANKEVRPELISPSFVKELATLLAKGAVKYEAENWRKGTSYQRYVGALERHLTAWRLGEERDSETNIHHLICVAFSCMVLHEMETHKFGFDDRPGKIK